MAGSFRIAEGYVEVTADESAYDRAMARLQSKKTTVKVGVDLDDKDALAKLARLTRDRTTKIFADADTRAAASDLDLLTRRRSVSVGANLDEGSALSELTQLASARTVRVTVELDDADALGRLAELTRDRMVHVVADADTRVAAADLANLTLARRVTVNANADTGDATARLAALTRDRRVNVRVDVDRSALSILSSMGGGGGGGGGVGMLSSRLAMLTSIVVGALPTIASLGQALIQMGPAAALAAPAVLSLATAFAAIKIGTSGVGAAFKAAFAPAAQGASAALSSAKAVEAAQRSLAKAEQGVKDAEVAAAAARVQAARQIQDAQLNLKNTVSDVADSNRRAAESVANAERDLATAQRAARQAQLDLTQARKDAAMELEDLNNRLKDAQLNQRQDILNVQDAEQNLAAVKAKGAAATAEELAKAQLQYDQAVQALQEQQTETRRLQDQSDAANKAGVDGSDKVTKAKQGIADANQTVKDKTQALKDAEIEAARQQVDGAQKIAKAQRDLADAQANAAKVAKDSARQIADAQQAAADAARSLAEAQQSAALKTGKVSQALSQLSPQARAFVDAVVAQHAAWTALKLDVQDALFRGLGATFTDMARASLPSLRAGLVGTAGVLNTMAINAAHAITELGKTGMLRRLFDGLNDGLRPLSRIPGQFITGLAQISIAASPAFKRLTTAVGGVADTISRKLGDAFKSGHMSDAINTAVGIAKQFGHLIADIVGTIGNVMKAAAAGGGNALGAIGAAFQELRKITAMPEVQKALTSIFSAINSIAKLLAGTLGAVIQAALPLLAALAPVVTELAQKFGPVLAQLAGALGKALMPIIEALLPVVKDVGGVIVGLVQAVMPLLQPIGALLATVIQAVAPFIKTLLDALVPFIAAIAKGLAPIVTALLPAFALLGQLLGALAPLFPQLLGALTPLIAPLSQLIGSLLQLAMQVITPLMPLIVGLAQLLTTVLAGALNILVPVLTTVIGWITTFVDAIKTGVNWVVDKFQWLYDVLVGHSIIPDLVNGIIHWFGSLFTNTKKIFTDLKNWVVNTWNSLWAGVRSRWDSFWSGLRGAISGMKNSVVNTVSGLKTSVTNTWNSLWGGVRDKVASIFSTINGKITSFKNGMKTAFTSLKNSLGTIWDGVRSKISAPIKFVVGTVYNNGIRKMWNAVAGKISSKITLPSISLGFNKGGIVPGSGNRDTVPAMLTPGERVLSNAQVDRLGGHKAIDQAVGAGTGKAPFFSGGGIIGNIVGAVGGALGKAWDWTKNLVRGGLAAAAETAIKSVVQPLINRIPMGSGDFSQMIKGMPGVALKGILGFLRADDKKYQDSVYSKVGKVSGSLKAWIAAALAITKTSASWASGLATLVMRESGGNPNAINNWDSNAKAGIPSQGLAQVIPPTFKSNHQAGTSWNILDPVANLAAAINYIKHRYGDISHVQQANPNLPPQGYDSGGLLAPGATMAVNATGKPERILSAEHTARLDAMLAGGAGGPITVQAINISGTFDFSSPASRKAAANAMVAEMKEALRHYDRSRA